MYSCLHFLMCMYQYTHTLIFICLSIVIYFDLVWRARHFILPLGEVLGTEGVIADLITTNNLRPHREQQKSWWCLVMFGDVS